MDIFFRDPDQIPLPPEEVRIVNLTAKPWEDGRRVRIKLEVTPFQKKPNSQITIRDAEGTEVAEITIIETIDTDMELTLHLRGGLKQGQFAAAAVLYYPKEEIRPTSDSEQKLPEFFIVDHQEAIFEIEPSGS